MTETVGSPFVGTSEISVGARKSRAKTGVVGGASTRPSPLFFSFFVFVLIFFQPRVPSLRIERLEQARYLLVVKYITDRISNSYQHWEYLFVTFVANIINDSAFSEV